MPPVLFWNTKRVIVYTTSIRKTNQNASICQISRKTGTHNNFQHSQETYNRGIGSLEVLDKEIQKAKYLKKFPKVEYFSLQPSIIAFIQGIRAPTFDSKFQEANKNFAKAFLFKEKLYEDLLAKISFFSEHPGINEQVLEYAVVAAILHRDDVSTHLPNPLEVAS